MPERSLLREHFSAMLAEVRTAASEYDRLARSAEDAHAREQLERLARDEHRHLELTERLLEIVDE
jgi:rubrerythrin